jgi:putative iron-dependent peroxidase
MDGCSYWALQQWQHDYSAFGCMSTMEQDHAVGRRAATTRNWTMPLNRPMSSARRRSFEPEAFVVRRSMPWWSVSPQGRIAAA